MYRGGLALHFTTALFLPLSPPPTSSSPRVPHNGFVGHARDLLDLVDAANECGLCPGVVEINGVTDCAAILRLLATVQKDMHLRQFDSINIKRGGVWLLKVHVTAPCRVGRSVAVDVFNFNRRVREQLAAGDRNQRREMVVALAACAFVACIFKWC